MSMSTTYLTKTLPESSLTQEGYIRFQGFPVAYVKSNLSVLLLLPFEELKGRPYYSATFNGFIELHHSVSRLCPHFTLALKNGEAAISALPAMSHAVYTSKKPSNAFAVGTWE